MSSKFANRRKPRKVGGNDSEEEDSGAAPEPVVKRPATSKAKPKSKLNLSFGPDEPSMAVDDDQGSEIVIPKRHGLGRKAIERSAFQHDSIHSGASDAISARVSGDQDRPSYSREYLKQLQDSTPSTPKTSTDEEKDRTIDVAAKFGEVMTVSTPSAIPSEAEIREKKARRARLALEHGSTKEDDFISLEDNIGSDDDWDLIAKGEKKAEKERDTRMVRDDEDFAEGFEEYVEDGKISLGRKAEREQQRKQREAMRELIDDAEGLSDEEDSDVEEKAAYEATQTKAAIGSGRSDGIERPRTPPKMTSLPKLASSLERLRTTLASMETSKTQMISRMEDLRREKEDIALREVEIQVLIKEAGENYERLKKEAGIDPATDADTSEGAMEKSRGLESIGAPMATSDSSSEEL
ncbi:uncharacterized protein N7482_008939 [Penicillium canariense]|uniref:Nineteen complex-related protein 2-domain-containing protein n=1 Tax=Penicillium canariense TaxID=189055 RepID=A0A9W9HWY4_9EURO|nr:uncharacterized protein N7482_008939 [Penicillium canariense]KAJ5157839.1 hypothetical protein N7482_008939 [Penicillium canariense]